MADQEPSGTALLARLRLQAGLTQHELAQRAGISRSMIAQIEMGERRPSRKMLARLAEALLLDTDKEHQLYVAFGYTPDADAPEQIAAFLRADKHLSLEQAERLSDLLRKAYLRELESSKEDQ